MNKDFNEFLELLNYHKVKYVIVGAHAVGIYSRPRSTGDLDILIEITPGNVEKIVKVLHAFGFGGLGLTVDNFLKKDMVIQLGYEPVRIDILTSVSGVSWNEVWKNRVKGIFGSSNIPVCFIGKTQLIKNKKKTGRLQDLADVRQLEKDKRQKSKKKYQDKE